MVYQVLERKICLNVGSENELKFTGGANNSFTSMIYSKSNTGCIKWIGEVNVMDSFEHTPVFKHIATSLRQHNYYYTTKCLTRVQHPTALNVRPPVICFGT